MQTQFHKSLTILVLRVGISTGASMAITLDIKRIEKIFRDSSVIERHDHCELLFPPNVKASFYNSMANDPKSIEALSKTLQERTNHPEACFLLKYASFLDSNKIRSYKGLYIQYGTNTTPQERETIFKSALSILKEQYNLSKDVCDSMLEKHNNALQIAFPTPQLK